MILSTMFYLIIFIFLMFLVIELILLIIESK